MLDFKRDPIRSYCVDFNWDEIGRAASPRICAHAEPARHLDWYLERGVNVIQTFCVTYNGYAWYKDSEVAPVMPGMTHDFLPELARLGHDAGVGVMGYFCAGSNPWYHFNHRDQYPSVHMETLLPLSLDFVDHLCRSIRDSLRKTDIDGFMLDWFRPRSREGSWGQIGWLPIEQQMYEELMDEPFPKTGEPSAEAGLEFDRRAVDRAWGMVRDATHEIKPDAIIWTNHPFEKTDDPLWNDSRLLREVDWVLNEGPDVEVNRWLESQIGPSTRIIQCMTGWVEHDVDAIAARVDPAKVGLYGFSHCDPVTTLPSEASRPKDFYDAEKIGKLFRRLAAAKSARPRLIPKHPVRLDPPSRPRVTVGAPQHPAVS